MVHATSIIMQGPEYKKGENDMSISSVLHDKQIDRQQKESVVAGGERVEDRGHK